MLKLVRTSNVLMIAVIAALQYLVFIHPNLSGRQKDPLIFIVMLMAICATAAAGYIVNNLVDAPYDQLKTKSKNPIPNEIDAEFAGILYKSLVSVGLILGVLHFWLTGSWWIFILVLLVNWILHRYSHKWQSQKAIGNIAIACCTGFMIVAVPLCNPTFYRTIGLDWIWEIHFVLAGMAVLFTFCREMVKDMEDVNSDQHAGYRTWAIVDLDQAKNVVVYCSVAAILLLTLWSLSNTAKMDGIQGFLLGVVVLVCILLIRRLQQADSSAAFGFVSLWYKGIMLLGVVYMLFWET